MEMMVMEDAFYAKCGLQSAEWHRGRKGGGRNNSSAQSPLIHGQITTIIIGTITTIIIGPNISLPQYPVWPRIMEAFRKLFFPMNFISKDISFNLSCCQPRLHETRFRLNTTGISVNLRTRIYFHFSHLGFSGDRLTTKYQRDKLNLFILPTYKGERHSRVIC